MADMKIAIVDDHALIADALAIMINRIKGYTVTNTYTNGNVLKADLLKKNTTPDIIILDVNMPEISGQQTAEWVTANYPAVKILALSMQDNEKDIMAMIKAGANGYLLKSIQPQQLEIALNTLVKDGFYYSQMVNQVIAQSVRNKLNVISVTDKEKELLQFLCTDLSYKEIAAKMFLSTRTIETYSNNLMERFGVRGRIGLLLFAQKNALV